MQPLRETSIPKPVPYLHLHHETDRPNITRRSVAIIRLIPRVSNIRAGAANRKALSEALSERMIKRMIKWGVAGQMIGAIVAQEFRAVIRGGRPQSCFNPRPIMERRRPQPLRDLAAPRRPSFLTAARPAQKADKAGLRPTPNSYWRHG